MPSLKAIRNRIRSVQSTQQITRAMKMVSAAKFRRAQEALVSARPYARLMSQVMENVSRRVDLEAHPLLERRPVKRVELVVFTSERGLCGGFNSNIIRRVQRFLVENEGRYEQVMLSTIGRKGYDYFKRGPLLRKNHPALLAELNFDKAKTVAEELAQRFLDKEVDGVYLLRNDFVSAVSQKVALEPLLPIAAPLPPEEMPEKVLPGEYEYEPERDGLLADLLPRYLANKVWQALLESVASEHAARMTAMDSATNNASDMSARLTLQYNRTRQAAITKELMEVVGGAEALK